MSLSLPEVDQDNLLQTPTEDASPAAQIRQAIARGESMVLVLAPSTAALRPFIDTLIPLLLRDDVRVIRVTGTAEAPLDLHDLMRQVLKPACPADTDPVEQLCDLLTKPLNEEKRLALLVDGADRMTEPTLRYLELLASFAPPSDFMLQLILAGTSLVREILPATGKYAPDRIATCVTLPPEVPGPDRFAAGERLPPAATAQAQPRVPKTTRRTAWIAAISLCVALAGFAAFERQKARQGHDGPGPIVSPGPASAPAPAEAAPAALAPPVPPAPIPANVPPDGAGPAPDTPLATTPVAPVVVPPITKVPVAAIAAAEPARVAAAAAAAEVPAGSAAMADTPPAQTDVLPLAAPAPPGLPAAVAPPPEPAGAPPSDAAPIIARSGDPPDAPAPPSAPPAAATAEIPPADRSEPAPAAPSPQNAASPASPLPAEAHPSIPRAAGSIRVEPPPRTADLADILVERGNAALLTGDVTAARLMYERAARSGSAPAAIAMGMTYDERFLAQIGAQGITPDLQRAAAWYRRAAELGSAEAEQFLKELRAPAAR